MQVTRRTRLLARLQNGVFYVLFLALVGLLGYASQRYHVQLDWTAGGRNTLSEASRELVARIEGPVEITAYAREDEMLRQRIDELVQRYRRHKPDLGLRFVNPDRVPDEVRRLGVTVDGELLVAHRGRTEHVREISEQALSNALARVGRGGERHLSFLTGHGERDLLGEANHDLGGFGRHLENRGFTLHPLRLAETGAVPANTRVLVIASPEARLLPGEAAAVVDFVEAGGNLLWLLEPGELHGLEPLAAALGVTPRPGTLVDPTARLFGIADPAFVLAARYAAHPVTRDFDLLTVYPRARALAAAPPEGWQATALLSAGERTWSETGSLEGEIRFDEGADLPGPLDIGFALSRSRPAAEAEPAPADGDAPPAEQRVLVVGDGDFLSNTYLGNGGNLDLGLDMLNWLASDDRFLAIPAKRAPDLELNLGAAQKAVIGLGALLGLPAVLLGTGFAIWWRRRRS